jgi:transaldolase
LVAKTGRDFEGVVREICTIVDGPVNAEVISTEAAGMIEEGQRLARIHPNVFVKVPMTAEGLKATKAMSSRGIRLNVTLVFSAAQALLAAKAGASFISPFVGRLDDTGHDGMLLIEQIVRILRNYTYGAEVLVASVRSPLHIIRAAEMGAHIATCPFAVLQQTLKHPLTDIGLERFLADWKSVKR